MTSSTYDTQALARRLNSADEHERQQAQTGLRAVIAADARRITRVRNAQYVTSAVYMVFYFYTLRMGYSPSSSRVLSSLLAFTGVQYLISLTTRKTVRRIAALDIPQAVGPLIEVALTNGWFRPKHVKTVLIRLLPRLRPADAGLFTPLQRKYLGRMLCQDERFPWDGGFWGKDLKIAILRALEQIGDEKAFSQVEKMARSAHDLQVRYAARECLPFLQQRVQHTRIEQTLLRASTQSHTPDVLLRPATANALLGASDAELLRATHNHDAPPTL